MKKIIIIALIAISYCVSAQSLIKDISGDTIVYVDKDYIFINGLLPIRIQHPNHLNVQYDDVSNIWCINAGVVRNDCARVDEELWLFYTDKSYYYSWTDWCNKICFWKGDEDLQNNFRPNGNPPKK